MTNKPTRQLVVQAAVQPTNGTHDQHTRIPLSTPALS